MEYCSQGDLNAYLTKHRENNRYISEPRIWKFFIHILLGLDALHSKRILHRDLKSLNVFLTKNNVAKVGDLGVAKVLNDE